jgi:hypothetical protein
MTSFFSKRLNKDNLWNIIFALAMGFSISLSFTLVETENNAAGIAIFWSTILIVPFTVRKMQKITFSQELGFLDRLGNPLKDRLPKKFPLALIAAGASCALIGNIADNMKLDIMYSITLIPFMFFLVINSYFIIINCPISILFYKKAWALEEKDAKNWSERNQMFMQQLHRINEDSYRRSASFEYSFLSTNIHHKKR